IFVQRDKNSFYIKDDGTGMTAQDFQDKFLKIGFSKRKKGATHSPGGRPFIGRKGNGKLALLSCAGKVTGIPEVEVGSYVGGTIDNSDLDEAIKEDLKPQEYILGAWKRATFAKYKRGHKHGTIIHFEGLKEGVKGSFQFLSKVIALYFRFSLLDS